MHSHQSKAALAAAPSDKFHEDALLCISYVVSDKA